MHRPRPARAAPRNADERINPTPPFPPFPYVLVPEGGPPGESLCENEREVTFGRDGLNSPHTLCDASYVFSTENERPFLVYPMRATGKAALQVACEW